MASIESTRWTLAARLITLPSRGRPYANGDAKYVGERDEVERRRKVPPLRLHPVRLVASQPQQKRNPGNPRQGGSPLCGNSLCEASVRSRADRPGTAPSLSAP